jgi:ethanolamine utilization protein EutQ (cupin superfamily)|tara:strand:- start:6690 stop:7136 length:447 start_codon:yes stop_codon:yes gene_type:complete
VTFSFFQVNVACFLEGIFFYSNSNNSKKGIVTMAFTHYQQIRDQELPSMEIDNVKAFLKDFSVSEDTDKPITSGLFRLEAGESLEYTYTYHEMKLIVDGSFIIQDESGQKVTAKPGDLFYFPKGSTITFSTPDFGVGFFCGQRGEDEA